MGKAEQVIDAATGAALGEGIGVGVGDDLVPVAGDGEAAAGEGVDAWAGALGEDLATELPALPQAVRLSRTTSTRILTEAITDPRGFGYGPVGKLGSMAIEDDAARLRAAAEAKPMKLPVNRRVDESHHTVTADGLSVWYTIQRSPHSRIQEVVFERDDRMPSDVECKRWLDLLVVGALAVEASSLPGSMTRRFEAFERDPGHEAPLA